MSDVPAQKSTFGSRYRANMKASLKSAGYLVLYGTVLPLALFAVIASAQWVFGG